MDNFIVSARKYRPLTFETVVGQKSITTTLKNAIRNKQLAQAYLFCGPRGVGKTTCARILAKTINCLSPTAEMEACGECESCQAFADNSSYNIHELDAASNNSVEDIRNLIDQVRIPPQIGKYSVYIIDEVHMLSQQAFNAFLKTLEEPPAHAIFIMATTEKHKILPTILSRCQIFDFNRIKTEDITKHLQYVAEKEGVEAEEEGLNIIAQKTDGAMRDALSIFDQVVSFTSGKLTYQSVIENLNVLDYDYFFKLTDMFLEGDYAGALSTYDQILSEGFDGQHFLSGLAKHYRDLLVSKDPKTIGLLEAVAGIRELYQKQSQRTDVAFLYRGLNICNSFDLNYKSSQNQRLHVELALFQLSRKEDEKKKDDEPVDKKKTEQPKQAKPISADKPPQSGEKKKEKPQKPVDNYKRTPSLKDLEKQQQAPEAETETEESKTGEASQKAEINQKELEYKWENYSQLIEAKDPFAKTILKSAKPKLQEGNRVLFPVSGKTQKDHLGQKIHKELEEYLNEEFNGNDIRIEYEIREITETERKPYTDAEKFKYLSNKYPGLETLRSKLDLDF